MKIPGKILLLTFFISLVSASGAFALDAKPGDLICVGLYSETAAGSVSYRTGNAAWIVIKVGDVIPAKGEIRVNVDRDWIELIQAGKPTLVYEITGSESAEVIKKVSDILKEKPRKVSFPMAGKNVDSAFKDKLVVTRYLGRQIYKPDANTRSRDIKYGDVLDIKGNVNIIAINNTLTLMYPNGNEATVVGPLKFNVEKMFTGENLYKYLNVAK
jgi:hypothetical protein